MKRPMLQLLLVLFGFFSSARGAAESATDAVRRIDGERLQAMMAGDGAALGRVLSDELVFVHSDGRVESKADYVKNLMAGDTAYTNARTSELRTMKPSSDVVVLIGRQDMRKRLGATWSEITLRFLSVWRNEGGTWRMVAWQSMRPAGSSVVPGK
ncbi:MAG: nuclear transport factor 2 family protein [Verrucomicrobia bacterium]|nr:nuclear transport factor 2 family protein [Verrucomicrobiota bacterium]